jgi:hypothetical protein
MDKVVSHSRVYNLCLLLAIIVLFAECGITVGSSEPSTSSDVSHNETDNSTHGEAHEERYNIAGFDFTRVQTPLVVSLWLLLAVITKLCKHCFIINYFLK